MVKASKGPRRRTRSKLRKGARARGLSPITRSLQSFEVGQKVCLYIDPSVQDGQPHPRFHGLTGIVTGRRGRAYIVEVRSGGKLKTAIVRPAHLKRMGV